MLGNCDNERGSRESLSLDLKGVARDWLLVNVHGGGIGPHPLEHEFPFYLARRL